ncbi:MAG: radical SAM protein [Actinobacteria bacterium]|nr:radical SAM protein [Actinomycetota bacterium]MBU1944138.1 radical SAM protein [Actinomycetota bacterium]MBU2687457.1 radical SAM protein [Actinomycetota bacterium]
MNDQQYPAAMVNITNRCTLRCRHCFVFREENPNDPRGEMDTATMLEKLAGLKERHGIHTMLWMGGEPLLRPDVLEEGVRLFPRNHITTNGTLDLIDFGRTDDDADREDIYVVSIDGPPELNDSIRGAGCFEKVMRTLSRVPERFGPKAMCQCVVTRANEGALDELVELLRPTRLEGMAFSFYVPRKDDDSDLTWGSLERRDEAVRKVMRLKERHPEFVWNNQRSLELMLSPFSKRVTDNCPSRRFVLPLYLDGDEFVIPHCCYGNDVDCDLCGAWVVFYIAALLERAGVEHYSTS